MGAIVSSTLLLSVVSFLALRRYTVVFRHRKRPSPETPVTREGETS